MTRIGYWDHADFDFASSFDNDDFNLRATLDIESLIRDFTAGLQEKEDAVLEPIVVDWLRGRGWIVEQ